MGKRANGEGSVYQRASDQRWVGTVTLANGKRQSVYGGSQRAARQRMRQMQREIDEGRPLTAHRGVTVGTFLSSWLQDTLPPRVQSGRMTASTLDSYDDQIRRHVIPVLGHVPLKDLTPAMVRSWLALKQTEITPRGRALSARSVAYLHAIVRSALGDAVRDELVARNVATLVQPPRVRRSTVKPLTVNEAQAVLTVAATDRLHVLWLLMISLGLRRGEALALRWSDLDLGNGSVRVSRSLQRLRGAVDETTGRRQGALFEVAPKTEDSVAVLAMPATLTRALRQHRLTQDIEAAAAHAWLDPGLVFTTSVGTALEPRNINRAWASLCERAGIRKVRLHDLRHSAASFLLLQGVDMKVVQATLRHSRLATTADLYTHVLAEVQRSAADRMDDLLLDLGTAEKPVAVSVAVKGRRGRGAPSGGKGRSAGQSRARPKGFEPPTF